MAKAGRYGSGAHGGQIAEAFGNIASDQYNKERLLQLQTLPALQGLQQNFTGLNQQVDDDRYAQLQRYFSFAQPAGGLGGSQTTPYFQNSTAGALGGAMAGAQLTPWFNKAIEGISSPSSPDYSSMPYVPT
jgi:hypothetical protein